MTESAPMSLATHYSEAWNTRNAGAILALHSEDSVFQVHGASAPRGWVRKATGREEIRDALETFFATWTRSRFEPRAMPLFGNDHWVLEWTLHATVASPKMLEGGTIAGADKEVSFEGVDVIRVSNGRVTRKDTYIDALALQAQLGS